MIIAEDQRKSATKICLFLCALCIVYATRAVLTTSKLHLHLLEKYVLNRVWMNLRVIPCPPVVETSTNVVTYNIHAGMCTHNYAFHVFCEQEMILFKSQFVRHLLE